MLETIYLLISQRKFLKWIWSLPFAVNVILHLSNNMNFDVTITERC